MLKRINQHVLVACATLFAVMGFFFLHRLAGDSPTVADMAILIMCCALFGVTAIAGLLEDLERKLEKWLEAKTGAGPCSVSPVDSRLHRHELERTLASTLAPYLANNHTSQKMGAYIRGVVDAMLGAGQTHVEQAIAMAAIQPQADALAKVAGMAGPSVTAEQIQALMSSLTWRYEQPEGSRHTFAHAFLGDFYLVSGYSAPVSHANFDAGKGMKYAREQAEGKARDKLWELEGYALFKQLA